MHRSQQSRRRHHSSSFTKFVARIQHTFSSKNIKSSTPVIPNQQPSSHPANSTPIPIFPSFTNYSRCRLSQILYDPSRQVEYLSEIEERTNSDISEQSLAVDDTDSCYDSMSEHRNDRFNLSQMNVSMDELNDYRHQPMKLPKLPYTLNNARLHSTAINDMGNF
ncbi:unnamed protein product [Adineta steineri]|uniref:Uncharacterized protein n=2 Tax=Adineta steineri TaxID=433720 RepID=A0A818S251_9BILA|nr:unnamed protein product [Adineta steineri]CAF1187234.1 unnamed protein product [Adineta steineri]CAF3666647.1 unnamed protein product [Adineta steineri]CAF3722184.1 unnamed protein product [Adineta steineri]CAF3728268.1 unnamed protein product [Adineta steineri]